MVARIVHRNNGAGSSVRRLAGIDDHRQPFEIDIVSQSRRATVLPAPPPHH
jgi:hypothetical protein